MQRHQSGEYYVVRKGRYFVADGFNWFWLEHPETATLYNFADATRVASNFGKDATAIPREDVVSTKPLPQYS